MTLVLGAIADDFTGATDLANNLVRSGMRTVQMLGVPTGKPLPEGVDAVRQAACGVAHTLLLVRMRDDCRLAVLACGGNNCGQLGLGDTSGLATYGVR